MSLFKHILVPIDFAGPSERALGLALKLARTLDSRVLLLHVASLPATYYGLYAEGLAWPVDELKSEARAALDKALAGARERYPKVDSRMVGGQIWESVLETVKERGADLIVMGTHGRHGLARAMLGSVAEKVVRHAPVPVLTVGMSTESWADAHDETMTAVREV